MATTSQIIYVENEYNDEINHFFMHHRDNVLAMARKKDLEFVYIPQIFNDISSSGNRFEELVHYYFPFSKQPVIGSPKLDYFTTPFFTNFLFAQLDYLGTIHPGLVRYTDHDFFDYVPFDLSGEQSLEEQCALYFSKYPDVSELPETDSKNNVLEKIQDNIQQLKDLGIYEIFLKEIGKALNESPKNPKTPPDKLSRLVIDADYRIGKITPI
jgi:hypothetical protein